MAWIGFFVASSAFAWGELGHQIVSRAAARLLAQHPAVLKLQAELEGATEAESKKKKEALKLFLETFDGRSLQQAHLANVPDIYWRNLEPPLEEDGQLLGDSSHFLNAERIVDIPTPDAFFKTKIALPYSQAKEEALKRHPDLKFFVRAGTLPWRAQQLASLYAWALDNYPDKPCAELQPLFPHPTQVALAYAGVMSHKTGDASQPFHVTIDYDGVATGQKGLHGYFETDLVNALEGRLELRVQSRARALYRDPLAYAASLPQLHEKARSVYGEIKKEDETTALVMALVADSFFHTKTLRDLDRRFALATFLEAQQMPSCHGLPSYARAKAGFERAKTEKERKHWLRYRIEGPSAEEIQKTPALGKLGACRRSPRAIVNSRGEPAPLDRRSVADWHADLIIDRLALAAVVTADIWARGWLEHGQKPLCWTWRYALKPSFVSPTDEKCFGYALKEEPNDFLKKDGKSALPWKGAATSTEKCVSF